MKWLRGARLSELDENISRDSLSPLAFGFYIHN